MASEERYLCVNPEAMSASLEDSIVILDVQGQSFFSSNDVGSFIWRLIQRPQTLSDIKRAVLAEYEVDETKCEKDIFRFLEQLIQAKLVKEDIRKI
jgi:hypothetical protein